MEDKKKCSSVILSALGTIMEGIVFCFIMRHELGPVDKTIVDQSIKDNDKTLKNDIILALQRETA